MMTAAWRGSVSCMCLPMLGCAWWSVTRTSKLYLDSGERRREEVGMKVGEMLLAAGDRLKSTEAEEDRLVLLLREMKAIAAAREVCSDPNREMSWLLLR